MQMNSGLWGVVNIAGTLNSIGPADWLTISEYRQQCDVNLFGLIDVTTTFLPLVKKTQGRIVNMSSNFGVSSYPIFAPYSVSKFGIEAFSDALRYVIGLLPLVTMGRFKSVIWTFIFIHRGRLTDYLWAKNDFDIDDVDGWVKKCVAILCSGSNDAMHSVAESQTLSAILQHLSCFPTVIYINKQASHSL